MAKEKRERQSRSEYKERRDQLELQLGILQRLSAERKVPVLIVFEGWQMAGLGKLLGELIRTLDPRSYDVHNIRYAGICTPLHPFWERIPAAGHWGIFPTSWYRRHLLSCVDGVDSKTIATREAEFCTFERQLVDSGAIIVKLFLRITRSTLRDRLADDEHVEKLNVSRREFNRERQYKAFSAAAESMLASTDQEIAPWDIITADRRRDATIEVLSTIVNRLTTALENERPERQPVLWPTMKPHSTLADVDLSIELEQASYSQQLTKLQRRFAAAARRIHRRKVPVVFVYEGWDAAGKGGSISRITRAMDPRRFRIATTAAPTALEHSYHYLWRFWNRLPPPGHITIFDRSWYGRVLVERVEGFCEPVEWQRAYEEINEMEAQFCRHGMVVLKFFLHIDAEEQLRRFERRQTIPHKQWKLCDEDWRNRDRWDDNRVAADDMLNLTHTEHAPWHVIPANSKRHARIETLRIACEALENHLSG